MNQNAATVAVLLQFIYDYRQLEKAPLTEANKVISNSIPDQSIHKHLKYNWRAYSKQFGRFFLNLSWENRHALIKYFGIEDSEDARFVSDCEASPRAMLFAKPTGFMACAHKLLLFFNNHGINEVPATGIKLTDLPAKMDKRYGNSSNWAEYILTHRHGGDIITQIMDNYEA